MLPLSESRLPLFGREAELGLLTGLLDAVQRSGAALVLRGEPGIGKSRLLAEAMSLAGQRTMSVLATRGVQSEARLAFAGVQQLLRPARSHAAGLSPAHRSVLDAALGIGDEHPPEHFRIALAVLDLLSEAAASRPLLLIAEDAHWLDQPSVDVLSFVARRLESEPIVLLAAARDGYPAVFRDGELPELRLRPLDPASSARLLEQSTDTLSSAERGQVLREAAGNPLALVELPSIARRLEDEHSMPGLVPLTERMERAFAARAADLPPPCAGTWHTTLAPLPHLFRVLWPFWFLRGHPEEGRVRQRVEQLLPIASSLGRQAEEELLWTAGASATDLGDDQAAQAVRQRLEPLLPEIRDPFLSAVADLFMAWSTPITGDLEQALHEASACLDKLRGQDEPFFTSVAEFTASTIETALGRYDQALRHLGASRALADESGISWLVAGTRVQQGILQVLQVLQGKPDEARPVLAEALNLSLAARSTPWTALSLAGHARLALATGDARRAARLAGAAQGLRLRSACRPGQCSGGARLTWSRRSAGPWAGSSSIRPSRTARRSASRRPWPPPGPTPPPPSYQLRGTGLARHSIGHASQLDEMHLGVVRLVVDKMVAGRTVPAGLDRGAARGVPERLRRVGVPGPPVRQQAERPRQFLALGRQLVGGAGRPLGVRPGHQQAVPFEPLESVGQDVRRDTGNLVEQLIEPARPGEQRLNHQQGPPVAHPRQRLGQR